MANVLVEESFLQDIADAIRGKNGGSDTYTPAQMGPAVANLSGGAPVLGTKTITYNGTFPASEDSLDGYSSVTVSRDPALHPIAFDTTNGYVSGSIFYAGGSGYYTDVYAVESGHTYRLGTGTTRGNRFDAAFFLTDPSQAESSATGGTQIASVSNPASKYATTWTASADGYVAITKTSGDVSGLISYVFDITLTEDL